MKLRDYQEKINKATIEFYDNPNKSRAQIYAPTGSGKTVCFIKLIEHAIQSGAKSIAIAHPRIALSQDQLRRIEEYFGDSIHYTSFHSGKNPTKDTIRGVNTTNPEMLCKIIGQVIARPHITLSSYHSFGNLNDANIEFDLIICDEAHYCVDSQFIPLLSSFNSKKVIFYTATPVDKDEAGMTTHCHLFGEAIAEVTPLELIKPGYIVAPMIQWLDCKSTQAHNSVDIVDIIKRSYVEQYKITSSWGVPYHQMLVVARDVKQDLINNIEDQASMREIKSYIAKHTGISSLDLDVYTISSTGTYCNGAPVMSRATALDDIKKSNRHAIVCHYDTLSEGIDIDTLTGCVILRQLSKSKFIQTIGRLARPFQGDMEYGEPKQNLYNPHKGIDYRTKPRCIVTIPVVDGEVLSGPSVENITAAFLFGGYGDIRSYIPLMDWATGTGDNEFTLTDEDEMAYSVVESHTARLMYEDLLNLIEEEI